MFFILPLSGDRTLLALTNPWYIYVRDINIQIVFWKKCNALWFNCVLIQFLKRMFIWHIFDNSIQFGSIQWSYKQTHQTRWMLVKAINNTWFGIAATQYSAFNPFRISKSDFAPIYRCCDSINDINHWYDMQITSFCVICNVIFASFGNVSIGNVLLITIWNLT